MTEEIVKAPGGTLAQRLADKMVHGAVNVGPAKGTLLLDISGSMFDLAEPSVSKIDALRKIVNMLNPKRTFVFSDSCWEIQGKNVPNPQMDTWYSRAFEVVKASGATDCVMVTDGIPSDPLQALEAVRGLRLEIIYVGPEPRPTYLDDLARACGGSIATASLAAAKQLQLAAKIRGLLTQG